MLLLLTLEITFQKFWMALDYHYLQNQICIVCTPFWVVLGSKFVNITDLILSKLKYMIFTESKLLSCWSCFISRGSSSCLTSWIDLLLLSGLWSCYCLCTDLHNALKWLVFLHLPRVLLFEGHCLWRCPVPQYLPFSTHFCFLWMSLPCFIYYVWQCQCLWPLVCCTVHLSVLCVPPCFGAITVPSCL